MSKLEILRYQLFDQENIYRSACYQLSVLNIHIENLTKRYEKADSIGHLAFRYSLRMRMTVAEGARNMFYEFATKKAFMINKLRQEILVEYAFADEEDDHDQGIAWFDYPMYLSDYDTEESDSDESGDENENDSNEELTWRETGLKISRELENEKLNSPK